MNFVFWHIEKFPVFDLLRFFELSDIIRIIIIIFNFVFEKIKMEKATVKMEKETVKMRWEPVLRNPLVFS